MFDGRGVLPLGRLFGIEIRLHVSVLIIFMLITIALGRGVLPTWHADWSGFELWGTAFVTACVFLMSLLAHELSHATVAQHYGMKVPRITLFVFGGMAEIENEAPSPKVEFLVAAAGPLMSFALALLFLNVAFELAPPEFSELWAQDLVAAVATLGVIATACLWLGTVNMVLGIFNLLPGFPLDGGRLFRALIWWRTGDEAKATRHAANGGRFVGWGLMGWGFFHLLQGNLVDGLWLLMIGWFISHLAMSSLSEQVVRRALNDLSVRDLMRTRFDSVDADLAVADFVNDHLLRSGQLVWPVSSGGRTVGVVGFRDVARVPEPERRNMVVGQLMHPLEASLFLEPNLRGHEALRRTAMAGDDPLPVIVDSRVVGLLHRSDILKWLNLHELIPSRRP